MAKYAQNTRVSKDRTVAEIERLLNKAGAEGFGYGWDKERATVQFQLKGKFVKFLLPMPEEDEIRYTPTGRIKEGRSLTEAKEQEIRRRWRSLYLLIKAKLTAVSDGIRSFETEFMQDIVMPDGSTMTETFVPQLEEAYRTGRMPVMQIEAPK